MTFLNAFKDGTMVINGMPNTGKAMYARKVVPGKLLNPAKNGTIFVRNMKPAGKVLHWFKGIGISPTFVVVAGVAILAVGLGYGVYKAIEYFEGE